MAKIDFDTMDIDVVLASIEFRLHTDDFATWHILNEDNEIVFSADEAIAVREFETNYISAEQLAALELDLQVCIALQAEDAANRQLSY